VYVSKGVRSLEAVFAPFLTNFPPYRNQEYNQHLTFLVLNKLWASNKLHRVCIGLRSVCILTSRLNTSLNSQTKQPTPHLLSKHTATTGTILLAFIFAAVLTLGRSSLRRTAALTTLLLLGLLPLLWHTSASAFVPTPTPFAMSSSAKALKKGAAAVKDAAVAAASGAAKAAASTATSAPSYNKPVIEQEQERKKSSRKRAPVDYNEERVVASEEAAVAEQTKNKKPKGGAPKIFPERQPLPTRDAAGKLHFADHPEFTPNMTPKEVLRAGSFGGGYFRPIYCTVNEQDFKEAHKEFPKDWFEGLDVGRMITSKTYRADINTYGVKCGGSLEMWQTSGWITAIDPFGAFQWWVRSGERGREGGEEGVEGVPLFFTSSMHSLLTSTASLFYFFLLLSTT
jgi:hypothetical protein